MTRLYVLVALAVLPQVVAWSAGWSWSGLQVASAPTARQGHAAVEVGRKIYVIGGCLQEIRCFNDVHVFDAGARQWTQENMTGDLPAPRGGHTATLVGSDIFLLGGANSEATFSDAYRLDLLRRRWTKLEKGPGLSMTARTSHAATADGGRIYVFGGYDAEGKFLNDMWVLRAPMSPPYSPDAPDVLSRPTASWTRPVPSGEAPAGREGHSLSLVDRQLVLFGGSAADGSDLNDVYTYNIASGSWKQLPVGGTAPLPRKAHSALRHGRSLVVAGGCTSAAHCFSDVWRLDLAAQRWSQRISESAAFRQREGHSAAFIGGEMFVFGGCQVSECFNDVEVLNTEEPCPEECGGHGHCVNNLYCQCTQPGYTGHDCLQPLACHMDCGANGACGQDGRCVCSGGFSGPGCATPPRCPGSPLPCSGRGECLPGGTCRCQSGAAGADCFADAVGPNGSQPMSLRSRLVQSLMSLGTSQEQVPTRPNAHKDPITTADFGIAKSNEEGHAGEDVSPDCNDNCNWRGLCDAGVCYCQPGYSGRTCSIAKENTEGTVNILSTGLFVGTGFVASLATTLAMLSAQKGQKRAKEREAGYNNI